MNALSSSGSVSWSCVGLRKLVSLRAHLSRGSTPGPACGREADGSGPDGWPKLAAGARQALGALWTRAPPLPRIFLIIAGRILDEANGPCLCHVAAVEHIQYAL